MSVLHVVSNNYEQSRDTKMRVSIVFKSVMLLIYMSNATPNTSITVYYTLSDKNCSWILRTFLCYACKKYMHGTWLREPYERNEKILQNAETYGLSGHSVYEQVCLELCYVVLYEIKCAVAWWSTHQNVLCAPWTSGSMNCFSSIQSSLRNLVLKLRSRANQASPHRWTPKNWFPWPKYFGVATRTKYMYSSLKYVKDFEMLPGSENWLRTASQPHQNAWGFFTNFYRFCFLFFPVLYLNSNHTIKGKVAQK